MFKWIEHLQSAKNDLTQLTSSKTNKEFEVQMEAILEKLTTNPQFLSSLALLLNTQSQIKSLVNFSFEKIWKNIQLPNKKDQERTLYLLHELQFKLHQVEKEVIRLKANPTKDIAPSSDRTNARLFTVVDKRKTDKSVSKLV